MIERHEHEQETNLLEHETIDLKPREVLERYLEGEPAGSVKIHALGDSAAYRIASVEIKIYDLLPSHLLSLSGAKTVADLAAVKESIRQWQLSEHAAEYEAAFDNTEVWRAYEEANKARDRHRDGDSLDASRKQAANALLKDLLAINRNKSTQG